MQSHTMEGQRLLTMRKFNDSLPGRILTVILATLAASGLTFLIYLANRGIVPAVLQWVLVAGIGLAAGFSTRYVLAGRTYALRLLTAFLSLLIGLVFLGLISRGLLGTRLPAQDQGSLNLGWLGQFLLAALVAWLSLSAWKFKPRPAEKGGANPASRVSAAPTPPSVARGGASPAPQNKPPSILQPGSWPGRWENLQDKLCDWWQHGLPEPDPRPRRHSRRPSVKLQARHARHSSPSPRRAASGRSAVAPVRLIGKEEHRCPYCLEIVIENDPRGVRVCPICHTYHHADCWDVTGTCQVPHYHE